MKFSVKQKVLTIFINQYEIKDENGNFVFYVRSSLFFPYVLNFFNEKNEVVMQVSKRYFRLLKRYDIKIEKKLIAILKAKVSFFSKTL